MNWDQITTKRKLSPVVKRYIGQNPIFRVPLFYPQRGMSIHFTAESVKMPTGKYAGKPLGDLDSRYLSGLLTHKPATKAMETLQRQVRMVLAHRRLSTKTPAPTVEACYAPAD